MLKIAVFTNEENLQSFFFIKRFNTNNKIKDNFIQHLDNLNQSNTLIDVLDYSRVVFEKETIKYEKQDLSNINYNIAYLYECKSEEFKNKIKKYLKIKLIDILDFDLINKEYEFKNSGAFTCLEEYSTLLDISKKSIDDL
jgi:hypothetical protein